MVFMLFASPTILIASGFAASIAARTGDLGPWQAKRNATGMYAVQAILSLSAVWILWAYVVTFCIWTSADGRLKLDLLLALVCAPFSVWFVAFGLRAFWGLLVLPFTSPESLYTKYLGVKLERWK